MQPHQEELTATRAAESACSVASTNCAGGGDVSVSSPHTSPPLFHAPLLVLPIPPTSSFSALRVNLSFPCHQPSCSVPFAFADRAFNPCTHGIVDSTIPWDSCCDDGTLGWAGGGGHLDSFAMGLHVDDLAALCEGLDLERRRRPVGGHKQTNPKTNKRLWRQEGRGRGQGARGGRGAGEIEGGKRRREGRGGREHQRGPIDVGCRSSGHPARHRLPQDVKGAALCKAPRKGLKVGAVGHLREALKCFLR